MIGGCTRVEHVVIVQNEKMVKESSMWVEIVLKNATLLNVTYKLMKS